MKKNKKNKGFTLIELIVVIAILAILAAVAIPNYMSLTKKADTATEVASAAEYVNAINIFNTLHTVAAEKIVEADLADKGDLDTKLGDLAPTTDVANPITHVLARIAIDANGNATIDNKNDISGSDPA